MGFIDDVDWIMERTPTGRQVALFSATVPEPIKGIAQRHLVDPVEIEIKAKTTTAETIRQRYWMVSGLHKLEAAGKHMSISPIEAELLASPVAPIVILNRLSGCSLPKILAPENPTLGVMLPYSPLHHILLRYLNFPVVATSGNIGEEPICIDNDEALNRLRKIADYFLLHDRRIIRPVDDSVVRVAAGREMVLRRSRGYAPKRIPVAEAASTVMAVGGDLKNTIAVAQNESVWLSQHLGDLSSLESRSAFECQLVSFPELIGIEPKSIVCDQHPGYHSRIGTESLRLPLIETQHHFSHATACLAENGVDSDEKVLAVVWDGTGFGDDKTIWGGEFLLCQHNQYERYAWLKPFLLPGGEKGVRDPRYAAMGCLYEAGIDWSDTNLVDQLSTQERIVGEKMLKQGINTSPCSSAGRLFDAVSALCGLQMRNGFEGQAAMALEFAASEKPAHSAYPITYPKGEAIDWGPIIRHVIDDLNEGREAEEYAPSRFHMTLAQLIADVANSSDCKIVALAGGCFQNVLLLEQSIECLKSIGKEPIWHKLVPPNDGGLSFGQAVIASKGDPIQ